MKRALVTGAAGFNGRHLVSQLLAEGVEAHGVDIAHFEPENRTGQEITGSYTHHTIDLAEPERLDALIDSVQPHHVFHLAGLIRADDYGRLLAVNEGCTRHLLNAIRDRGSCVDSIIIPGSAAEIGPVSADLLPIDETIDPCPVSDYGRSKAAQSDLAARYQKEFGLPVVRTRTFNITGPGEPPAFICSAFARGFAAVATGGAHEVEVGPLGSQRDFVDVRDVVRAYRMAAKTRAATGKLFHIASGHGISGEEILNLLRSISGIQPPIVRNPAFGETDDRSVYIGSGSRAERVFGWRPEIDFESSLREVYGYWLSSFGDEV